MKDASLSLALQPGLPAMVLGLKGTWLKVCHLQQLSTESHKLDDHHQDTTHHSCPRPKIASAVPHAQLTCASCVAFHCLRSAACMTCRDCWQGSGLWTRQVGVGMQAREQWLRQLRLQL